MFGIKEFYKPHVSHPCNQAPALEGNGTPWHALNTPSNAEIRSSQFTLKNSIPIPNACEVTHTVPQPPSPGVYIKIQDVSSARRFYARKLF